MAQGGARLKWRGRIRAKHPKYGMLSTEMNAQYVNPFVEAVFELFSTMLQSKVARIGLGVSNGERQADEVMSLIGFSGVLRGTVALAMPLSTSQGMVRRLLGDGVFADDETVSDTIAEMVNIVAGAAKSKLSLQVKATLELSLPVVVHGEEFEVFSPSQAIWLEVPFTSDLGPLCMRLSFLSS